MRDTADGAAPLNNGVIPGREQLDFDQRARRRHTLEIRRAKAAATPSPERRRRIDNGRLHKATMRQQHHDDITTTHISVN